jgi:hypothetical protein
VPAVSEFQSRSVDKEVMELALVEDRILLTEDKDFGWLVFAGRIDSPGVICDPVPSLRAEFARRGGFEAGERICFTTTGGLRSVATGGGQNQLRTSPRAIR